MINDSCINPVTFKTTLSMLNQLDMATRNHRMSRSDIIRAGITLILSKLAIRGVTDNTDLNEVSLIKKSPSISIDDAVTTVATISTPVIEDDSDSPCAPSLYGWS